ncbi:MAG: hypothetical protein HOE90_15465 [Bacteriovoracaceae bacterium]|jgi:hypothetical protein|nr:hypothetical protein [Bacteriovoracaceae bacterium]
MIKNILIIVMFVFSALASAQNAEELEIKKMVASNSNKKQNGRTYNFNFYNGDEEFGPSGKAGVSEIKKTEHQKTNESEFAIVAGYFSKSYNQGNESFPYEVGWNQPGRSAKLQSYKGLSVGARFINKYGFSIEPKVLIGNLLMNSGPLGARGFEGKVPGLRVDLKSLYRFSDSFGLSFAIGAYGYNGSLDRVDDKYSYTDDRNVNGLGGDSFIGPGLKLRNVFIDGGIGYGVESSKIFSHMKRAIVSNWNVLANLSLRI